MVAVVATDADDPTYGNSAQLTYSILQGQPYFSVEPKTGEATGTKHQRTAALGGGVRPWGRGLWGQARGWGLWAQGGGVCGGVRPWGCGH